MGVSCVKQVGYGFGVLAYNFGGSIPVGVARGGIATYHLCWHGYRIYCLEKALPSEVAAEIERKTGKAMDNLSSHRFTDYRSGQDQIHFWFLQVARAISEIFFPFISSIIWTVKDLTTHSKERNKQHQISRLTINLCGMNDFLIALKWEKQTWAALAVQG